MNENSKLSSLPLKGDKVFDAALFEFLANIGKYKQRLLERHLTSGKVTCPRCKRKTLVLTLRGTKNHLWASCANPGCTFSIIE